MKRQLIKPRHKNLTTDWINIFEHVSNNLECSESCQYLYAVSKFVTIKIILVWLLFRLPKMLKLCYTTTMQKRIITVLILSILMLSLPIEAKTLKGEVKYTVKQAREEAFSNVEYTLPQSIIKANLTDPNYKENKKAIKLGATELKDRYIEHYSDGGYALAYKNNMYIVYYYKENGKLETLEKRNSLQTPTRTLRYNAHGELEEVSLFITPEDSYIFTISGELKCHWVGDKGYDKNGKVIITRY